MKTFLIIDAHALIHRAYHALPASFTAPDGTPANAVYGFSSVLIKVLKQVRPDYVVAAFDLPEPTFRHEAYEDYKATRAKADDDLVVQIPIVREVVAAFGIPILEHPSFEADDIIGTVVEDLKDQKDIKTVIVTGDLDALQLVDGDKVVVYTPRRGVTDTVIYNEEKVRERYGLSPSQLIDFKGLKGDPSDNIPGVPGVGEKTATGLLKKYSSLENLYKRFENDEEIKPGIRKKLAENRDQAFFSRELATIRRDAPIAFSLDEARYQFEVRPELVELLKKLSFPSLLNRLDKEDAFENIEASEEESSEKNNSRLAEYYKKGLFSKKIYELEQALTPVLRRMEKIGFLVDVEHLNNLNKKFKEELNQIQKKTHNLAGEEFNLNSPREVGRILFEKLGLKIGRVKKTKTGQYSTAASELEKLKDEHEIVPLLLRWRELSKLVSTYINALPKLVDPKDGRIHTTFNQLGAATGRLSSENPNLQNIPVRGEHGTDIRKAFIVRKEFRVLAVDYSQIELRVAASLSKDKTMIEAFQKGEDIHTRTAAEVSNVPIEKVTKSMRRTAKILNFGVLYGMGANSFARAAGIGREEARDFIDEYQTDFSGLTKFIQELKDKAYAAGYAETIWGRKRSLPELSSPNPGMRATGERMAVNMPIQGTATGDIIKAAMVKIDKEIRDKDDIFMILQVHDEIVFEVRKDKVEAYAPKIKKIMEGVIDLAVPLEVDLETGFNWGEMNKINA